VTDVHALQPLQQGRLTREMLPDLIGVDDWGYPLLPRDPVPREYRKRVARARAACPALALRLVESSAGVA